MGLRSRSPRFPKPERVRLDLVGMLPGGPDSVGRGAGEVGRVWLVRGTVGGAGSPGSNRRGGVRRCRSGGEERGGGQGAGDEPGTVGEVAAALGGE